MLVRDLKDLQTNSKSKYTGLGWFLLANFWFNCFSAFAWIVLIFFYFKLVNKPAPSLVQLSNGESISVAAMGSVDRKPEVVKTFATNVLTSLFTWTGYLPPQTVEEANNPKVDLGVKVEISDRDGTESKKEITIPTSTWESSFALSEDFRTEFLAKLGQLIPADVFENNTDIVFVPISISEPQQIQAGKWKLVLIANLLVFEDGNKMGKMIPFRKEVFIKATEAPNYLTETKSTNSVASIISQVRASGLEIYGMKDYKSGNL
jgi:hypothetical protein